MKKINPRVWDKYTPLDWIDKTEIHLYIPITSHIGNVPAELRSIMKPFQFPDNDRIKVFFYDLPCDKLGERAIQVLYGSRNSEDAYREYIGVRRNGMTFSELKHKLSKTRFKMVDLQARGLDNTINAVKFHGSSSFPTISSFLNRLNSFTDEGLLNSSTSPYSLPRVFRENGEWKNQKAIVLLYSGFIQQEYIRVFNLVSFIEFQWQAMSGLRDRINFKVVDYLNELSVLFPKQKDKFYRGVHQALTNFGRWLIPQSRHSNIELWADFQHFDSVDEFIRSQFSKNYVTRYTDDLGIERCASIMKINKGSLRRVMDDWGEKGIHRFFDMRLPVNTWEDDNNKKQIGCELPRPKLSCDEKVSLRTFEPTKDFRYVWEEYKTTVEGHEAKVIAKIKEERARAKKARLEEAKQSGQKLCEAVVKDLGINVDALKGMDKATKDGTVKRVMEEVLAKFNITVSPATAKRALRLWS